MYLVEANIQSAVNIHQSFILKQQFMNQQLVRHNHVPEEADFTDPENRQQQREEVSTSKPFIEANTIESSLSEIQREHIIPVFIKDNEPMISHADFIEAAVQATGSVFTGEAILRPSIRLSHPIKGRVPEAKHKAAKDLLEGEKTIYYERMAFCIEIPTIYTDVTGNRLNLTVGGVKAYNLDNLATKSGGDQHFKVFIGFQNKVCTNLCVSSDGFVADLKVKNLQQLYTAIYRLISDFNPVLYGQELATLQQHQLTEHQFAVLIGRCRMYRYLPDHLKQGMDEMMFGDSQINCVCRDYYRDNSFCRGHDGSISLWNLYNLFTGANKSSYIDLFLDRGLHAYQVVRDLKTAIVNRQTSWFLS